MKFYLYLLSALLLGLAWLLPYHYRPWATYSSEYFAFAALLALLLAMLNSAQKIPQQSLGFLLLSIVPLVHLALGEVYFSSVATLPALYIFSFWLASVLGYNLAQSRAEQTQVFEKLSYLFLSCGVLTGLIAIIQWVGVEQHVPGIMNSPRRPFANFAQPNNMATFLVMSLLSSLYLYEKQKIKSIWIIICILPIIIAIAMSQSRTAWVATAAIFVYLGYQQYRGVIKTQWWKTTGITLGFVALLVVLPYISQWLAQAASVDVVQTQSVIARASGDMSRLAIWQQMLHAIALEPWFGHGFYQTSTAFVQVSEFFQGPVWIRSSHNFVIDFLIWNGLVVGLPFLIYFGYIGYQLHRHAYSAETVIGLLMIGVFMIHAMLEFPQHYAYFLLPVGFILGILQASQQQKNHVLSTAWLKGIFAIGLVLLVWVHRDYNMAVEQLNQAARSDRANTSFEVVEPVYLLTEFNHRAAMIRLNPYRELSEVDFQEIEKIVQSYPTPYNLIKYARALAFNGYEEEARYQLQRLKWIKKINIDYDSLLENAPPKS